MIYYGDVNFKADDDASSENIVSVSVILSLSRLLLVAILINFN